MLPEIGDSRYYPDCYPTIRRETIVYRPMIFVFSVAILAIQCVSVAAQEDKNQESVADRIARTANKYNTKETYKLEYKLKKGDEIRWDFEQVVSTKFQMAGFTEESSSRSENRKLWKVANVDRLGNMTFSYTVESVKMWTQTDEAEPVAYDSATDAEVPELYNGVADGVGKPQVIFSIAPDGKVLDRKSVQKEFDLGLGNVTTPLPADAVPIGFKWHVSKIMQANDDNDRATKVKARVVYELAKVKDKNAYISFRTEILTPDISEKVKSTIMQKVNNGIIVFDMDRGFPVLTQVKWDEKAQGFEGPDSFMKYVGNMTEKIVSVSNEKTATTASTLAPLKTAVANKPVELKTRESKPILRK